MICPACSGIGLHFGAFKPIVVKCDVCDGTGIIDNKKQMWIKQGAWLKGYRTLILKKGLREVCREYGLDPSYVSKMERGVLKPVNIYKKFEKARGGKN